MVLTAGEIQERQRKGQWRADRHGSAKLSEPLGLVKPKHTGRRTSKPKGKLSAADKLAVKNGCWYDERFANYVRDWAEQYLQLWEGEWAGQPFKLMPWQWKEVIAPLFGWFRWDKERKRPVRRFDRAYIEVAKKNGKSPLAALIGCYLLAGDGDHGNSIFSTGTKRDQAAIVHRHANNMVENSPEVLNRCKLNRSTHGITYLPTNSVYRALASDAGGSEGLNGSVIIDELHAWRGRDFYDSLRYMGASRAEPLVFQITTAGDDMGSVCREQHDYAVGVTSGVIKDDGFLGFIAASDESDDPGKLSTWKKANPSLGTTVFAREMKAAYNEAKESPSKLNAFKRYRLNQWVATEYTFLQPEKWAACSADFQSVDMSGTLYAGMDLSRVKDLTAFVLSGKVDGELAFWPYFWITQSWLKELQKPFPKMAEWAERGLVTVIQGEIIDYDQVFEDLDSVVELQKPVSLIHDRRFASDSVARFCDRHGIEAVDFPQVESHYTAPINEFERRVISGKLKHPGHDLLSWQVGNCLAEEGRRGRILRKRKSGDYRTIDGVVAAVMALSGHLEFDPTRPSVYQDRGIMTL